MLGDFNTEMSNPHKSELYALYNFTNLIKEPTCFKNVDKPTSIDHTLTNHARCFQHSDIYETGLSDFLKPTFTVLKIFYAKQKPKIIKYRDYKNFNNISFKIHFLKELSLSKLQKGDLDKFTFIVINLLDKTKHLLWTRAFERLLWFEKNHKFRKENLFIFELAYKRQRNFCTTLTKKTKRNFYNKLRNFYNKLSVNKIIDNKSFWKTMKPSFIDKTLKGEKVALVENDTTFSEENDVAEIFQFYFAGIVDCFNIKRYEISKEHSDPIIFAIKNFEKHPRILKKKELNSRWGSFPLKM